MTDRFPDPDPPEAEAEALLRRARPLPSDAVVERMERRLLGRPRRRFSLTGPLGAGLAAAGAAAAVLFGLALAGTGPLGGHEDVRAGSRCDYVRVERRVREPVVVRGADGQTRIAYRARVRPQLVKRCR